MLNRRQFVKSLVAAAITMLPGKVALAHENRDEKCLDLAEAIRYCAKNPPVRDHNREMPSVDLSAYRRATPEAIEFLAGQGYDSFVFIGLDRLDTKIALALAGWGKVFFCFSNLESLDTEIAAILAGGDNTYTFDNCLMEISPETAKELASSPLYHLDLNSISLGVATELAKHPDDLTIQLKIPPSEQILQTLSNHAGYRLHISWERPMGSEPCNFLSPNEEKRVFVSPSQWFENVYIIDADYYPDPLPSEEGVVFLL